jgi:hypothetical protein
MFTLLKAILIYSVEAVDLIFVKIKYVVTSEQGEDFCRMLNIKVLI